MNKMKLRLVIYSLIVIFAVGILSVLGINIYVIKYAEKYVFTDIKNLPNKQTVLVLGAKVQDMKLSPILYDRVVAGMEIYKSRKASKILLSGDHGSKNYDEVNAMKNFVVDNMNNIDYSDVFMDHAGFDTYDSMYRAREIFGVKSLIIVTQEFHIYRAVYLARKLGLDAIGFSLSESRYSKGLQLNWDIRECLARVKAFFEIILDSEPKFLGVKIPIEADGTGSWD